MIHARLTCVGFLAAIFSCALAQAADENNAIAPIEPFIDAQTILVARLDATRVNFDAIEQWLGQAAPDRAVATQEPIKAGRQWVDTFRKSGGKSCYIVVSFGDTAGGMSYALAPVENGADAQALETALSALPAKNKDAKTARIGSAVVLADEPTLEKLRHFVPSPRPDIARALAEDPAAALTAAIVPSDDTRKVVEAIMPKLPAEMGGGPSTVLTHGLLWATLTVHLPPDASLTVLAHSQNADSAQALAGLIRLVIRAAQPPRQDAEASALYRQITQALAPEVQQDRVVISLQNGALAKLAAALPGQMIEARAKAATMESINHVRQLLIASYLYAQDHNGQWPDTLEQAAKAADAGQDLLVDPRHPAQHPGYTYVKPPKLSDIPNVSRWVVIYDAVQDWPKGVAVGFADGHAEVIKQEADFKKLLDESKP